MEQNQTTNGVQRQLVLRMFLPNMETLKATAREVSAMPGVKLGLYGQAGEVLVAVTVTTATAAAATSPVSTLIHNGPWGPEARCCRVWK